MVTENYLKSHKKLIIYYKTFNIIVKLKMKTKKSDNLGEVEKLLKKVNYIMDKLGDKKSVEN